MTSEAPEPMPLDPVDRAIINTLQGGFPIVAEPYREVAGTLGITEQELMGRIDALLAHKRLSRFGPMYHAEKLGGALTLAALAVPTERYDEVAGQVNGFPQVAHNYAREHELNMWFVLATETPDEIARVIQDIETATNLRVYNLPKLEEFYVGLHFDV